MVEGKTLIQIGIGSFLLAMAIGALSLKYFPIHSLGYIVGGLLSFILLLLFLPFIMWGYLKQAQKREQSFLRNKVYFWGSIIGFLGLSTSFLIITFFTILYTNYGTFFFIPLYFSLIYLIFALFCLKYRKASQKI